VSSADVSLDVVLEAVAGFCFGLDVRFDFDADLLDLLDFLAITFLFRFLV